MIGVCLSLLQGGGCTWCLPNTGKGVGGAAPRSVRGKISKARVNKEADGERERKGKGFDFRFPQEDERWNKMFERLRCFSPPVE